MSTHSPVMPELLVVVRHGEYDGNLGAFPTRVSRSLGLNERGREQVLAARKWLADESALAGINRWHASPILRAQESAALINGSRVPVSRHLIERSRGFASHMSKEEGQRRFPEAMRMKAEHPVAWVPPGGESLFTHVGLRIRRQLAASTGESCLWATHAEFMWGVRFLLAGFSESDMTRIQRGPKPKVLDVNNAQIDMYSRRSPSGDVTDGFSWFRSVTPYYSDSRFDSGWSRIDVPLRGLNYKRELSGGLVKVSSAEQLTLS